MLTHINVDAWKTVHSDRTEFPWSVAVELFPVLQSSLLEMKNLIDLTWPTALLQQYYFGFEVIYFTLYQRTE